MKQPKAVKEARITYFGWTDYSISSLEFIIKDLQEDYIPSTTDTIQRLEELRKKTIANSDRLEDPSSVINYIGFWVTLFQSFVYDLKRVLNEMPNGVEKKHIEIIRQIYKRSCHEEKDSYRGFKEDHIEKDLKDESLRPLLDEVCSVSGNLLGHNINLGSISKRLVTFIGSKPSKEKKPKTKRLVPFPAPPGTTWEDIEISFL
jgi:hypothetical protein